jgi:hypothetical protein
MYKEMKQLFLDEGTIGNHFISSFLIFFQIFYEDMYFL